MLWLLISCVPAIAQTSLARAVPDTVNISILSGEWRPSLIYRVAGTKSCFAATMSLPHCARQVLRQRWSVHTSADNSGRLNIALLENTTKSNICSWPPYPIAYSQKTYLIWSNHQLNQIQDIPPPPTHQTHFCNYQCCLGYRYKCGSFDYTFISHCSGLWITSEGVKPPIKLHQLCSNVCPTFLYFSLWCASKSTAIVRQASKHGTKFAMAIGYHV